MTSTRLLAATVALLAACAPAGTSSTPAPAPTPRSTKAPTTDELRRDLAVFASDSFRGREAGTPDERRAARFLVERLAALGVEPAGDSGFYQKVPLISRRLTAATAFTITSPTATTSVAASDQLIPLTELGPGAPLPRTSADGGIVFAGYGLSRPDLNRDDFSGLSAEGKVVVVVNGAPPGVDDATRAQLESESAIGERLFRIVSLRPAAVVILLTGKAADNLTMSVPDMLHGMTQAGAPLEQPDSLRTLPMVLLGRLEKNAALLPTRWPTDDRPQILGGRRFTARVVQKSEAVTSYNVVGVVPGIDPALRSTYVAYGAHYDHLGVLPPVDGDSIANGADDDGSGSMALLAIAKAFATSQRPRRSVLFVWHTGEEKGLLGSEYFTAHPTVSIKSIVAQINADMIGRNTGDSVYIVGPNAAPDNQSRVLGWIADSVNARQPRPLVFDRTFDDPAHPEHIYERSDHYSYAQQGIPIVFFTGPLHPDYHRVTDEPQRINYESLTRITWLLYDLGRAIADRDRPPR